MLSLRTAVTALLSTLCLPGTYHTLCVWNHLWVTYNTDCNLTCVSCCALWFREPWSKCRHMFRTDAPRRPDHTARRPRGGLQMFSLRLLKPRLRKAGRLCELRVKTAEPASQPETWHISRPGHLAREHARPVHLLVWGRCLAALSWSRRAGMASASAPPRCTGALQLPRPRPLQGNQGVGCGVLTCGDLRPRPKEGRGASQGVPRGPASVMSSAWRLLRAPARSGRPACAFAARRGAALPVRVVAVIIPAHSQHSAPSPAAPSAGGGGGGGT